MTDLFAERRASTETILSQFRERLEHHLGRDLPAVIGDHTTVYVTGSGGRGEMSPASDLDLFLVRVRGEPSRLDAVLLQASILRATDDCKIARPSRGGVFLDMHSADEFARLLGSAEDDAKNKFTARMLFLLESRPILGERAYDALIDRMIESYWTTGDRKKGDFEPFMLTNDVIRYWRVVLLNHESRLLAKRNELKNAGVPDFESELKLHRYLRSYKLRFARCLTCFATLAHLLALSKAHGRISPDDIRAMVKKTPWQRLDYVAKLARNDDVESTLSEMRSLYEAFLVATAAPKDELLESFANSDIGKQRARSARRFCDLTFQLLHSLGMQDDGTPSSLYRYMLV